MWFLQSVVLCRLLLFYKLIIITCIPYTAIVECSGTAWIRILRIRVGESCARARLCVTPGVVFLLSVSFVVFHIIYLHCERHCHPTRCQRYMRSQNTRRHVFKCPSASVLIKEIVKFSDRYSNKAKNNLPALLFFCSLQDGIDLSVRSTQNFLTFPSPVHTSSFTLVV